MQYADLIMILEKKIKEFKRFSISSKKEGDNINHPNARDKMRNVL